MFLDNEELFNSIRPCLENKLHLLKDKPEENIESTLKALWFAALGIYKSTEKAVNQPLPELMDEHRQRLFSLIDKRLDSTPLAHITGRQNFMDIELLCDRRALIPRKETEILGKEALRLSLEIAKENQDVTVIDVCCGSGNLGLAIASHNSHTHVYVTDLSQEAVDLAQENILFLNLGHRVSAKQGDLLSAFATTEYRGKMDLIVCNPPYLSSSNVSKMDKEISAHEPFLAFDGGVMGINLIQRLIREAPGFLTKSGRLLFEVGAGQGPFLSKFCKRSGFYRYVESVSDELGNIRVIVAQK
jgi:release factor glutamine methyltransferase